MTAVESLTIGGDIQSVSMVNLGGRLYPLRTEPRCKVCNSPHRLQVERGLVASYGYRAIIRTLPDDHGLTDRNLKDHVANGHLPLEQMARRVLVEERAREIGLSIENTDGPLGDHITLARLTVQDAIERLLKGELKPTLGEALQAAKLLNDYGLWGGSEIDREAITEAFTAYWEAVTREVDPETMGRISRRLTANPVIRSLMASSDDEDESVEAESWEEAVPVTVAES